MALMALSSCNYGMVSTSKIFNYLVLLICSEYVILFIASIGFDLRH